MFFLEFLQYLKDFTVIENLGLDDSIDRINYQFSVIILLLLTSFVSLHQFVLSPIVCYVSNSIGGANADNYLQNMCWTEGLYPMNFSRAISQHDKAWNDMSNHVLGYYQWMPLILGLQALLYWIPSVIWQLMSVSISGINFPDVMRQTRCAHLLTKDPRRQHVQMTGCHLFALINMKISMKRKYLFVCYLLYKTINICVNYITLKFINYSMAFDKRDNFLTFGWTVAADLANGRMWPETQMFPRQGMCRQPYENLGAVNYMFAQCALPINMLNEKIFVFLYFYIVVVSIASVYSLFSWLIGFGIRDRFKSSLKNKVNADDSVKEKYFDKFENKFLKSDGCFVLQMFIKKSGSMISEEIITDLFYNYVEMIESKKK